MPRPPAILRTTCALAAGIALAANAPAALAEPTVAASPSAHANAVARFEEGTRLVEQGDCNRAIPKLIESLKYEEGVGARLNLADCYARGGETARAWIEFKAAERFATLKGNDERREVAHNGAYALERKLLRLTLTVPYVEGLEVRINGVVIDRDLLASRLVAVAPGDFAVEARAPRKLTVVKRGSGAAGTAQAVVVAFQDDPAAVAASAPREAEPSTTQRTIGIVVGATGIALVAAGAVFGVVAAEKKSDLEDAFAKSPSCRGTYPSGTCSTDARATLDDKESSAFTAATLSTVFFVAGGVVAATGAVLFFTAPSRLRIAPSVTATAQSVVIGGVF